MNIKKLKQDKVEGEGERNNNGNNKNNKSYILLMASEI